jgi:hypothetical protein
MHDVHGPLPDTTILFVFLIVLATIFFQIRYNARDLNYGPIILTMLGILGCFIGIALGLGADAPGSFSPHYRPNELSVADLEELAKEGKDVSIDDVVVLEDNTLKYKNSRVLVYIRDISQFRNWVPRFHIADSETLQQKRQQNAFDRYVVATRDDGSFVVNLIGNGGQVTRKTI